MLESSVMTVRDLASKKMLSTFHSFSLRHAYIHLTRSHVHERFTRVLRTSQ